MNTFVWTDLSTFDVDAAKRFYHALFGWEFVATEDQSMDEKYHVASLENDAVAAVFRMPEKLRKLNLPSFWMSYIQVKNLEETLAKAKKHKGVIVEIPPISFDAKSRIALLRDPSGAGFTLYKGENLNGRYARGHGRCVWNGHHVSDIALIQRFYEDVFDWKLAPDTTAEGTYEVRYEEEIIAHVEVLPEGVKGPYEYWMPVFAVDDVPACIKKCTELGGSLLMNFPDGQAMLNDPQGGTFLIQA